MNWNDLIFDLIRAGLTETDIARKVGTSQCAVNKLKNGHLKEPRWSWGNRLVNLHSSYVAGGFINDRKPTGKLGKALENGVSEKGNYQLGGQLQTATRG